MKTYQFSLDVQIEANSEEEAYNLYLADIKKPSGLVQYGDLILNTIHNEDGSIEEVCQ